MGKMTKKSEKQSRSFAPLGFVVALRREDVLHGEFVHNEQPRSLFPRPRPQCRLRESLQSMLATIKQELRDAAQR